ncbi:AMP-binding protein [Amnibacterium kyonggiense]
MPDASCVQSVVRGWADRRPDAPALESARSRRTVTYADLDAGLSRWRGVLGEAPGTVLVTVAEPVAAAVALVGVIAAGGRAVVVDPTTPEVALRRLEARLGAGVRRAAAGTARSGPEVIPVDDVGRPVGVDSAPAPAPAPAPHRRGGGGASLLFTSGSSGVPKGVELDEERLLAVARQVVRNQALTTEDRAFNPLPLFHVNAQVVGLLATVVAGGAVVLDARFHRTGFWPLLAERRITWLNAVPAMLAVLARTGPVEPPGSLRFIRSASAPLPDPVRRAFGATPFVVSWGMTEAASQITATPPALEVGAGDVGFPLGTEVAARDEAGAPVGAGVRGELWIRGEGVVRGYLDGVAADRFDADGWLRTGDVGHVAADGRVVVSGRADDVINRGGELVDPAEVEAVLLQDARVQEAAVVARPSEVLGQEAVALVVIAPGADGDGVEQDLLAHAAAHLPAPKRPASVHVVAELPRSAAGKVSRRLAARGLAADAR